MRNLLSKLLSKKVILAQTQEDFDKQAEEFLASNGFPLDNNYKAMFGQYIQMSPPNEDTYSPKSLAKHIRKAVANELAYYLIKPEKRPVKEASSEPVQDSGVSEA